MSIDSLIETARSRSNFSSYRFPDDLGPNSLVLDFVEYSYDATFSNVNQSGRSLTAIVLPLPQQLQDIDNIDIASAQLGTIGSFAVGSFGAISNIASSETPGEDILKQVNNMMGQAAKEGENVAGGNLSKYKDYLGFAARNAMSLSPELGLAADVATGTAINPHTTLNFSGVGLKQFTFNWQLAPKNETESESLRRIISRIKSHILPKTTGFGDAPGLRRAILKYPDIAQIRLNGIAQKYFPEIRPGMISNFTVDYTPQGVVLVGGGKPAIVNLAFTFTEAQIRTSGEAQEVDSE